MAEEKPDNDKIILDKTDVLIVELAPEECEGCDKPATKLVQLGFGSAGMKISVGKFCEACAASLAEVIRESLSPPIEE